jgi:hypothetical protein
MKKLLLVIACVLTLALTSMPVESQAGPIRKVGKAVAAVGRTVVKVIPGHRARQARRYAATHYSS